LKHGDTAGAESDFRQAIALALTTSARAWELRATMSLARLLAQQGRRDEARTMLADIYDWFAEAFDTAGPEGWERTARPTKRITWSVQAESCRHVQAVDRFPFLSAESSIVM
jgi:hypothetical protein